MSKAELRKNIDKGARLKQYFLRGHNSWFALGFSLLNFTLIFNNLLWKNLYFIPDEIKSYTVFLIIFGISYFPIATIVGYFDFRKGTYTAEQNLAAEMSPIWQKVFTRLNLLEEGNEEVKELLVSLIATNSKK